MKNGTLALAGLIALLAVPVAATGDTGSVSTQSAERGQTYSVSFKLQSRNNRPVALKRFRFRRLVAVCNGGATVRTRGYIPYIRVKSNRTFGHTLRKGGKKVRIAGRVKRNLRVVKGTIRVTGRFAGETGCNTGLQRWKAS